MLKRIVNTSFKIKHAMLCVLAVFCMGAGMRYYMDSAVVDTYIDIKGSSAPALSNSGQSRIYFDSTYNALMNSATSNRTMPVTSRKNALINGDFTVWQRGQTFTSISTTQYTADRWQAVFATPNSGTYTVTQNVGTLTPSTTEAQLATANGVLAVFCSHVNTSVSAGSEFLLQQTIEGQNVPTEMAYNYCTLSFWVQTTNITGDFGISLQASATNGAVTKFNIPSTGTWYHIVQTFQMNAANIPTNLNGAAYTVTFCLIGGSNFQATASNSMGAGSFGKYTTSTQVNFGSNVSNVFFITGVQLEPGQSATAFDWLPYQQELALCQRYCYAIQGGTGNGNNAVMLFGSGTTSGTASSDVLVTFPVVMRVNPTFSTAGTATHWGFNVVAGNVANTSISQSGTFSSQYASFITMTHTAASFVGSNIPGWLSSASSTSSDYLIWSADF